MVSFLIEHVSFSDPISALSKFCYSHIRQLCCIRPYLDHKTTSTIATSIVHYKLDYSNSLYYNLPNTQLNRLQHIQHSLAVRAVVRPQSLRTSTLLSILSLTYKLITTTQPSIPCNLIPVQPHRRTRVITLSRPPSSSSLKVINSSFRHASPCLWNQLPKELRLPADHEDLSLLSQLSDLTHVTSSFPSSPPPPTITPSLFHSRLKTRVFHKSLPPSFFYLSTHRTDSIDSSCLSFSSRACPF